jgi:acetylornithine deacetylase/succinyl-diaminopimelate desuccinylase-like protein
VSSVLAHDGKLREIDLADIRRFLAIPSVSADPAYADDVRAAAAWLCERCDRAGLEHIGVMETPGHPSVYADWLHADGRPTVLLYGHFDVQPVPDPAVWSSDPFQPDFRDGRVYARGSSDMKCQLLASLLAVEDLLAEDGRLPLNVRVLFEGEEETLSPNLRRLLIEHRDLLQADFAVTADGQQPVSGRPRIGVGSRGFCDLEVRVQSADGDLHSGTYGGTVRNAGRTLAELLAGLYSDDGRVAVDGFYDDVELPSREERKLFAGELDAAAAQGAILGSAGEPDWSAWERATLRPSLEVNGLVGGYTGPGPMTVIPAQAHAKLSCRLVPDQDPDLVRGLVGGHLARHAPPAVRVTVTPGGASVPAYRCRRDHPVVAVASSVLQELSSREPELAISGGSLPVQAYLEAELGVSTITFGFSCDDENAHGIDEFHRLASFTGARSAYRRLYEALGGAPAGGSR